MALSVILTRKSASLRRNTLFEPSDEWINASAWPVGRIENKKRTGQSTSHKMFESSAWELRHSAACGDWLVNKIRINFDNEPSPFAVRWPCRRTTPGSWECSRSPGVHSRCTSRSVYVREMSTRWRRHCISGRQRESVERRVCSRSWRLQETSTRRGHLTTRSQMYSWSLENCRRRCTRVDHNHRQTASLSDVSLCHWTLFRPA